MTYFSLRHRQIYIYIFHLYRTCGWTYTIVWYSLLSPAIPWKTEDNFLFKPTWWGPLPLRGKPDLHSNPGVYAKSSLFIWDQHGPGWRAGSRTVQGGFGSSTQIAVTHVRADRVSPQRRPSPQMSVHAHTSQRRTQLPETRVRLGTY